MIGAVEISRDITKDINVQKVMMQQEKLASVGRLSAGVAHEINNPLTTILTTAMLIQEDLDPNDPTYDDMSVIANEALRCRKIVTNLLNFARQTQPDKKSTNINEIIETCISLTQKQAAFKDVSVAHDLSDNLPPYAGGQRPDRTGHDQPDHQCRRSDSDRRQHIRIHATIGPSGVCRYCRLRYG